MQVARFNRLSTLFESARLLGREERVGFIASLCGDDDVLRDELEALLRHHDSAGGLDGPVEISLTAIPDLMRRPFERPATPRRIGPFDVEELIGEGGMGAVYRARQHSPPRAVALKVLRHAWLDQSMLRRFEFEAAILARLNHPGIAHIHDAGVFDDGSGPRPYFAMELVDGEPLTCFLDTHSLDQRQKLDLFIRICDAVSHAHQKGVIHRDLKPANVLVAANGQPKILDFGVARCVDADLQLATIASSGRELVGTVPYMSPEQIEGRAAQLDTRSDVYSLGVLLYEMLARRLPYDLHDKSLSAAARTICEQPPEPLADVGRATPADLKTVVFKALEKEPRQRYQATADLAADIARVLRHEPIMARPSTTWYRFRKFARRNRTAVLAAAVAAIALTGGLAAATIALIQARHDADRAMAINEFMSDVLIVADPNRTRAGYPFIDVLNGAGELAAARFQDHPDIEAEVLHLLGQAYWNLSQWSASEQHARRSWELRQSALGPAHRDTLDSQYLYIRSLLSQMRLGEAEQVGGELLERAAAHDPQPPVALRTRQVLAHIQSRRGDGDEAERVFRQCLAAAESEYGPRHKLTLEAKNNLVVHLTACLIRSPGDAAPDDYLEPIALLEEVTRGYGELEVPDALNATNAMTNLAEALLVAGRLEEAETQARAAVKIVTERFGELHNINVQAYAHLAAILYRMHKFDDAAAAAQRSAAIATSIFGPGHANTLIELSEALPMLDAAGIDDVGESFSRELHERFGSAGAHGNDTAVWYRAWLARFLTRQGRLAEAGEVITSAHAGIVDGMQKESHALFCLAAGLLARARGDLEEAERNTLQAIGLLAEPPLLDPLLRAKANDELLDLYEEFDLPEKAANYQRQLQAARAANGP